MSDRDVPGEESSLLPPDWEALAPLIDAVLDAAPERRAALIAQLAQGNAARQRALSQLVAECERDLPLLEGQAADLFDDLTERTADPLLPEVLADRYVTGRELGRGGMARVYLARDTKHGRDVAIKVINPELSASLGHGRFLREIEIAARLRHPNIVPLYDSGEVGGTLYFVMPFEEGRSLRDRLRDGGALPIPEALSVLRDIARALAHAHEHGVVHRDVKPDNVMLSGGAAVVTDFGIAKALSAALTEHGAPTITQVGTGIGTPAYMAPEQATGDPSTDHRADIYSFGCVAYELLTGAPPFPGTSPHELIAAHVSAAPPAVIERRPDVPPAVGEMIAQCLQKRPADRPQSVRALMTVLDGAASTVPPETRPVMRTTGRRRALLWGVGALAAAAIIAVLVMATRPPVTPPPITLAVLPLYNTNADSTTDFLGEGLSNEVASLLNRVPGIQVKSQAGARLYRGQLSVNVTEAGAQLKAEHIMTGMLRQDRGNWIVSAELARAADAASLWSVHLRVDPDHVAGAAGMIADSLVTALRKLFPATIHPTSAIAATRETTNEAYRLYLQGQEGLARRGLSVSKSAELFSLAIREDSLYAEAYSGLSMALALTPYFHPTSAREVHGDLVAAARKALQLNPALAQPHIALGLDHQFAFRWDSAAAEFTTAIQRDSRNVEARVQYARHLLFRGRHDEALTHLRVARAQDPASALVLSWLSYAYFLNGQQDSALAESRRALANDSSNLTSLLLGSLVRLETGQARDVRTLLALMRSRTGFTLGGYLRARVGDSLAVARELQQLDAENASSWGAHAYRAYSYLGLRDTARALDALETATRAGEIWYAYYGIADPLFRPIRGSPRFHELLRSVGLGDAIPLLRRR